MNYLWFILASLAVWRLTYDFINTDGPMGLYQLVKRIVDQIPMPDWLHDGFSCYHCISFWAGFGICLLIPSLSWTEYLLFSLGSSGAVTLTTRYVKAMYGAGLFDKE